jgi:hypothetical protein
MPPVPPSFGNSLGGVPSPIPEDDVRVYAQSMQMSLADANATRDVFGFPPSRARQSPPLSPSPVPLRGYAARPLGEKEGSLPPTAADDAAADAEIEQIVARTRRQARQQEADEDRALDRMMRRLSEGEAFMHGVERRLDLYDTQRHHRKVGLHKEWHDRVYSRIQAQIDAQLQSVSPHELSSRRREQLEEYLQMCNRKEFGLFRDIVIPAEYDPLTAHAALPSYKMHDRQDPLKVEVHRPTLVGTPRAPKAAAGRETIDVTTWCNIGATAFGHFNRLVEAPPEVRTNPSRVSRVPM